MRRSILLLNAPGRYQTVTAASSSSSGTASSRVPSVSDCKLAGMVLLLHQCGKTVEHKRLHLVPGGHVVAGLEAKGGRLVILAVAGFDRAPVAIQVEIGPLVATRRRRVQLRALTVDADDALHRCAGGAIEEKFRI